MRLAGIIAAAIVGGASICAAVWIAQSGKSSETRQRPTPNADGPPISPTAPWPKIVHVDNPREMFDIMELGEKRTRVFKVRNDGEAPLILKQGPTTCQCTLSEVAKKPIPPGGTGEITVTWQPTGLTDMFMKGAKIYTNDPENPQFSIELNGRVRDRVMISPSGGAWEIQESSDTETVTFAGAVYSNIVKEFQATAESSDPAMKVDVQPMSDKERGELRALSGYQIVVSIEPNKTAGGYRYPLVIKTDQKKRKENGEFGDPFVFQVSVIGGRKGAFRFFGPGYDLANSSIGFGSFEARKGKTIGLSMIVARGRPEGTKILSVKCDPPEVTAELVPTGTRKPGKPEMFSLRLTYPEAGPLQTRSEAHPGQVVITTDHPEVQEAKLNLYLNAY